MIKAVKGKLLIFVMIMVSFLLMISSTVNASFIEKEFLSKEDFERGRYADTKFTAGAGIITNEADKVVNGNYS
ncbi:hypothetical protein M5X02_32205, partial [Paenibacillus alvei]